MVYFKMIDAKKFFGQSDLLDRLVLRQLSHIKHNWELVWDDENEKYEPEEDSYAEKLNQLIEELGRVDPPQKYHENEDCLAEYVVANRYWQINKVNGRWVGADYVGILEQGGFHDIDEVNLILATAGRIKAATDRNQYHFDYMEQSHQEILANVLAIILYHRTDA
ncbi:hypothetical protein VB713_26630 [Anabaena cylindrica UHCC 0172]|uniref:hypothetical protein n=1 Tax=Anabaena cylindrica TaxID=1165 RepID=UPI002B216132|nr:hypothetical protein [Anabaena cylindrica]MEA5554513.1 hypothetical protein [Anabaena cylindrica UHCC 0172]